MGATSTDGTSRPCRCCFRRAEASSLWRMPLRLPTLYAIVDVGVCRLRGLDPLAVLDAFLAGGARFVQLRDKTTRTGALVALADAAVFRVHAAGARLIVNDRADVARLA